MDFNSLKDQVSNLTLYDLKAGVRKVQNAVMNYTEMESKVREATNNEPWGASSSLMQEIAAATQSYHLLNEIMPVLYKRFTEKTAEEWRQIYKALQLLEFLVKNGSERVVDDARSHVSLLKMLRQFHYIDPNGKDQGINVRNRSKELAELLGDSDRIRTERKKARSNRNKFGGVEGGAGLASGATSGGSRYGGFGSEQAGYGGYSGGVYGDGGGFGGQETDFQDTSAARRDQYEEYDENEEGRAPSRRKPAEPARREAKKPDPPKVKAPEIDLFSFDDDLPPETPPKELSPDGSKNAAVNSFHNGTALASGLDDDDFDDFQSASPGPTDSTHINGGPTATIAGILAPTTQTSMTNNFGGMNSIAPAQPAKSGPNYNISSPPPVANYNINFSAAAAAPAPAPTSASAAPRTTTSAPPIKPSGYQAASPNYFTSVQTGSSGQIGTNVSTPAAMPNTGVSSMASLNAGPAKRAPAAQTSGDAFGSLWSTASSGAGLGSLGASGNGIGGGAMSKGPNLASLQREKASQGIWGHGIAQQQPSGTKPTTSNGGGALDDLLG